MAFSREFCKLTPENLKLGASKTPWPSNRPEALKFPLVYTVERPVCSQPLGALEIRHTCTSNTVLASQALNSFASNDHHDGCNEVLTDT